MCSPFESDLRIWRAEIEFWLQLTAYLKICPFRKNLDEFKFQTVPVYVLLHLMYGCHQIVWLIYCESRWTIRLRLTDAFHGSSHIYAGTFGPKVCLLLCCCMSEDKPIQTDSNLVHNSCPGYIYAKGAPLKDFHLNLSYYQLHKLTGNFTFSILAELRFSWFVSNQNNLDLVYFPESVSNTQRDLLYFHPKSNFAEATLSPTELWFCTNIVCVRLLSSKRVFGVQLVLSRPHLGPICTRFPRWWKENLLSNSFKSSRF